MLLRTFALFQTVSLALALSAPATTTTSRGRVTLPGLDAQKFRHPLDRDLTTRVQKLPGIQFAEQALRRTFPVLEQGVRLDLLASSVKVSKDQFADLQDLLNEACEILDFDPSSTPELYVQSNPQANAYTLALRGKDAPPIVVITSALLDQCTNEEIQAILAHELGHLKCEHSLYLTLGSLAATPIRNIPLPFVASSVDSALQQWRLAAEYSCDRAAMLVAQDSNVVAGALLKLFAGTSKYDMSTDAFVAQCLEYDKLLKDANPMVRATIQRQQSQRTHPLPVRRVAELKEWAQSKEYQQIISKTTV